LFTQIFPTLICIVICFNGDVLQLPSHFFWDLLDSIIVDVASECHRVAKLGLDANLEEDDEELKLSAQARVRVADPSNNSNEANGKYVVDIFGQTHPTVANEIFDCMNCGRSIVAGRFAPHLEKCMGKVILFSHNCIR
jgi:SAGA-associated factor 11